MSKKLKSKKKLLDAKTLANLVIEEIKEHKECSLSVLKKMQQAFNTDSKKKQRESFVDILDNKLNDKQLHKLNNAIMENANELMPANDSAFLCRTSNNKIFQELLLLEAKRSGMKAKFNTKGELQPLSIKDISQEILNHYSILIQKFYPHRSSVDSLNISIAKSINFLLYAPLFRESEIYEKLGLKVAEIEHEMQNPDGKYIKNLAEEKIIDDAYDHNSHKVLDESNPSKTHKDNQKDKIFSIIDESIEKLEKSKKVIVKAWQLEKIKRHISKFLEEFSFDTLASKKKDLVDIIHQELYKNQSKWSKLANSLGISKSYGISGESLEQIGAEINSKINSKVKNLHTPIIKPEVQQQLKQISEELNKLNNPTLPSEAKKIKSETKPPIPKKPKNLKGNHTIDH